nr:MAG TPA: hypothetical protein [Caudoviricetes sp.]DAW64064.1 MAG TPA: hypothetical protein [Caudoviricetes sp.]
MQSDRYQGRFPGYTGRKLFEVEHPVFGRCTVAAPDENAALLPAARYWRTVWKLPEFYAYAKVTRAGLLERSSNG